MVRISNARWKIEKKKKQTSSSLAIHQDYDKTTERNISNQCDRYQSIDLIMHAVNLITLIKKSKINYQEPNANHLT
jgi:hypothetical protein